MKGKGGTVKAAGLFCAALAVAALWAPSAGAVERPPGGCHAEAGPAEPGLKLRVGWLAPAQAYTAGGPAMRTFIGVDTPMRTGADSHTKVVFDRNGAEWTAGAYIPVVGMTPEALYVPEIHYLDGTSFFDKSAEDKSKKPMSNREWHEFLRRMAEGMKAEKQVGWGRTALAGLTWQIGAVSSGSEHGFAKKFVGVDMPVAGIEPAAITAMTAAMDHAFAGRETAEATMGFYMPCPMLVPDGLMPATGFRIAPWAADDEDPPFPIPLPGVGRTGYQAWEPYCGQTTAARTKAAVEGVFAGLYVPEPCPDEFTPAAKFRAASGWAADEEDPPFPVPIPGIGRTGYGY